MENNSEIYYIVIQNRSYRHEYENDDYHLEKVDSKEEINSIIDNEVLDYFDHRYFIIVTNDETLLNKYLFTINIDEFKMLCKINDYNKKKIRINQNYFFEFNGDVFANFQKILNSEIITATMFWNTKADYPYEDESIGVNDESFMEWKENKEFKYFKTPLRYRKNTNKESIFSFEDYKTGNIETLKKMVNINILEIGTDEQPDTNWEWRNGLLKYYDKTSSTRLYIHEKLLQILKEDNTINFYVETKLNEKLYIEYYISGIIDSIENDDNNTDF